MQGWTIPMMKRKTKIKVKFVENEEAKLQMTSIIIP